MAETKPKEKVGQITLTWKIFRTDAVFIVLYWVWHNGILLQQLITAPILQTK